MKRIKPMIMALAGMLLLFSFRTDVTEPVSHRDLFVTVDDAPEKPKSRIVENIRVSSERFAQYSDSVYNCIFEKGKGPDKKVFRYAFRGYAGLLAANQILKRDVLAFIDYSLSANKKRFWVIDIRHFKVLYHELVAHGRNTGLEFARKFSNKENSFQSSLGFFITGEIYSGKHDLSIKMNGVERRFNDKALDRGIVIHGADYVSESFIKANKRLGRSLGCPAVSQNVIRSMSSVISNGVCMFLYYPNKTYLKSSGLLKKDAVYQVIATL